MPGGALSRPAGHGWPGPTRAHPHRCRNQGCCPRSKQFEGPRGRAADDVRVRPARVRVSRRDVARKPPPPGCGDAKHVTGRVGWMRLRDAPPKDRARAEWHRWRRCAPDAGGESDRTQGSRVRCRHEMSHRLRAPIVRVWLSGLLCSSGRSGSCGPDCIPVPRLRGRPRVCVIFRKQRDGNPVRVEAV